MMVSQEFVRCLHKISPIQKALLFGSTARGGDKWESDIDIALIISQRLTITETEKINECVARILLQTGMVINWTSFLTEEWHTNLLPIVQNIHEEGQLLWERKKTELKSHSNI